MAKKARTTSRTVYFNVYSRRNGGAPFIGFSTAAERDSIRDTDGIIARIDRTISFEHGEGLAPAPSKQKERA